MKGAMLLLLAGLVTLSIAGPAEAQRGRRPGGRMFIPPVKNSTYKTAPAGDPISATKQAKLDKLTEDLKSVAPDASLAPEHRKAIEDDLKDLADGAAKSCSTEIKKVLNDFLAGYPKIRAKLSDEQVHELATHLRDVVSPIGHTREQMDGSATKMKTLLSESGLAAADADRLVKDLKTLITEARKQMPQR